MRVQLLRDWRGYKPGKVFTDMPEGSANALIKRGTAREVSAEPPKPAAGKAKGKPCKAGRI